MTRQWIDIVGDEGLYQLSGRASLLRLCIGEARSW